MLSFDAAFGSHAGVALYSLIASNPSRRFSVSLLSSGMPDEQRARFEALGDAPNLRLAVHEVDKRRWASLPSTPRITAATYNRFLLPALLGAGVRKVLYLDCDLVVNGGVGSLWDMDVDSVIAAACTDIGAHRSRHAALSLSSTHRYFNAGVLLINLAAWKRERVSERALEFLETRPEDAVYHDQDALNVCAQNRVAYLSCIWNFMPFLRNTQLQPDFDAIRVGALKPVIVHYAGPVKPWNLPRETNPFVRLYWDWRRRSPWAHVPL